MPRDAIDSNYVATALATIEVVCTIVFVILTRVYLHLIRQILLELKSIRDPTIESWFSASEFTPLIVYIKNTGNSPAKNIRFRVITDCLLVENKLANEHGLAASQTLQRGIPYLAPHQTMALLFGECRAAISANVPSPIVIEVSFDLPDGRRAKRTFEVDLTEFRNCVPPD